MKTIAEINKEYEIGNHLTDAEMVRLRDFFHGVTVAVQPFGGKYELVFIDALTQERKLDDFLRARGIKPSVKERLVYALDKTPVS